MDILRFLVFVYIFFNVSFCKPKSKRNSSNISFKNKNQTVKITQTAKPTNSTNYDADDVINRAKKHIGTPYRSGGKEPANGFDCSGFTCFIYGKFNISLPPTASMQSETGRSVLLNEAQKGDLVFFKGSDAKSKTIGHVGIVVSNKGEPIKFIHASSSKGITISGLDQTYYRERFVKIRRLK